MNFGLLTFFLLFSCLMTLASAKANTTPSSSTIARTDPTMEKTVRIGVT